MIDPSDKLILRNARLVFSDRVAESAGVLIERGLISRILDNLSDGFDKGSNEIDLAGLTLFPGLIDVHIHGAVGVDVNSASASDLLHMSQFLASKGVAAWLPTLVPAPVEHHQQAIRAIGELMNQQEGSASMRARVLGVHYEGPFVNLQQCGALHREHFRTFTRTADLDSLPTLKHVGAIHMMTVAPEIDGGIELIKELRKRNWVVSIGHTRAGVPMLEEAKAAGARHMTHFMNAMTPLHHRSLGAVGWGLNHDDVTIDMIADGIHIDQSILKLIAQIKTAKRVSLISDAIAAAGMGDGDYEIWGERIRVTEGRTQNDRGHIAGSVITMLDAARMMLSLGFSEVDVARMASLNPARVLGIDDESGSIEEGKRADLVALDENLNVRLTIVGGLITHNSSLLRHHS